MSWNRLNDYRVIKKPQNKKKKTVRFGNDEWKRLELAEREWKLQHA